jgi:hypothetical protein
MPLWRDWPQRSAAAFSDRSLADADGDGSRASSGEA